MSATERGCKLHKAAKTVVESRRFVESIWMAETPQSARKVSLTEDDIPEFSSLHWASKAVPCTPISLHAWRTRSYVIRDCLVKTTGASEIMFISHKDA